MTFSIATPLEVVVGDIAHALTQQLGKSGVEVGSVTIVLAVDRL